MLHQLEGESCASIAAGLGVPVGTVYSRLHGARKAFRAKYESLAMSSGTPGEEEVHVSS